MKISRDHLKDLIKECLVEILSEGLGSAGPLLAAASPNRSIRGVSEARAREAHARRRPAHDPNLDTPIGKGRITSALTDAIRESSGGNQTMAAIFADTARTTLSHQIAAGDKGSGQSNPSVSQVEQIQGTPEQVFGEDVAAKWANLAFADAGPKKSA